MPPERTPHFNQEKLYTCAPAAIRMVLHFHGLEKSEQELESAMQTNEKTGTSLSKILEYAESIGFSVFHKDNADLDDIEDFIKKGLPVIVNYRETASEQGHFAVLISITEENLVMHDPWHGPSYTISKEEFLKRWHNDKMTRERTMIVISRKNGEAAPAGQE